LLTATGAARRPLAGTILRTVGTSSLKNLAAAGTLVPTRTEWALPCAGTPTLPLLTEAGALELTRAESTLPAAGTHALPLLTATGALEPTRAESTLPAARAHALPRLAATIFPLWFALLPHAAALPLLRIPFTGVLNGLAASSLLWSRASLSPALCRDGHRENDSGYGYLFANRFHGFILSHRFSIVSSRFRAL
jgi:hypothetical protein